MIDLKPACRAMTELLSGVADHQLSGPTPCKEYTVEDLIGHIDEVAAGFAAVAGAASSESADDWRVRVPGNVRALGRAWDDPAAWRGETDAGNLELPNELWGKIALTEMVVHGWDLARATDQSFDLPEPTLRACLDHVTAFVPNAPIPELWGPAVDLPADASLIDRVVARTGRDPRAAVSAGRG